MTENITKRTVFNGDTVKMLTVADFESDNPIVLKYNDCILVLFYVENEESYQIMEIWASVAKQTAGPVFAAINMMSEKKLAQAFTRLKSDGSSPLHWAALRQYPYILVYRNKWPVAVYNGPRETQALIDYSLTLACQAGYYEIEQLGGSMQASDRKEMGPYQPYVNVPGEAPKIRKTSVEYNAENPIRGFNQNLSVVTTGSAQAATETAQIRTEEAAQQAAARQGISQSLTPITETRPTTPPSPSPPQVPTPIAPTQRPTPTPAVPTPAVPSAP